MPTYEYECLNCNERFEIFQKITELPLNRCPKCNGDLKRLVGCGCGLIFKGSGFYITDYKKSKKENTTPKNKQDNKDKPNNASSNKTV